MTKMNESKLKVLAFHLPQYHKIPENDVWWGKGFTEWTNVKRAQPLYKGHMQPLVPLNNNYYDMLDVNTLKLQAETAEKYGIYGFVYYHYWFKSKMLLEKPCELLLRHPEIRKNYCFCWANESWSRTWDGKEKELLIKQEYGDEDDWQKHIMYLCRFFADDRYIKVNGHPMLFFYSLGRIKRHEEMIAYWNQYLLDHGFKELFIVEYINTVNPGKSSNYTRIVCEFEPHFTCRFEVSNLVKAKRFICKEIGLTDFMKYDYVWKKLLQKKRRYGDVEIMLSAFVNFDNSPRKGKKGMVFKGATPERFEKYLKELCINNRGRYSNEFLAINAWNEWGEGAILEPSEQYGYKFLEAVKKIVNEINNY